MRRLMKRKDGQFVIIAAVIVAMMMISLSVLLNEAATYYTHEPWDEYVGLIGNLKIDFRRLMEISLANYTKNQTVSILDQNLGRWQDDLSEIYPGQGIHVDYVLSGTGLSKVWGCRSSYSKADAELSVDISSIGLKGYQIDGEVSLNVEVQPVDPGSDQVELRITRENSALVYGLVIDNFAIASNPPVNITRVDEHYDEANVLVYTITCDSVIPDDFTVGLWDQRGIAVSCGPSETPASPTPPPTPSPTPSPTPTTTPEPSPTPTPPPSQTLRLYPSSDGSFSDLRKNGANKNWKCVDDDPYDADTTYVNTFSTTYRTDTYVVQDADINGTINFVRVYVTCRYTWVGTGGETCTVLRISGASYAGSNIPLTTEYQSTSTLYFNNPAGGAWTWADVNNLQCGVSLRAAGGAEARCTQVCVEVNYTP
jgi:hypothetical protein